MDPRWEALFGIASAAFLFLPLFVAMSVGVERTGPLRERARARRIAAYQQSPKSHLLRLS